MLVGVKWLRSPAVCSKPLEWAGFMVQQQGETTDGKHVHHQFKTPLWRSVLKLDLDDQLRPLKLQ